jgi:hypothetical protein
MSWNCLPTGKKIKYRPFLVREEKILIMALESEDMKQITMPLFKFLPTVFRQEELRFRSSTFDIEYLFLNIRAKSVGETVEVNVTCPDDGETLFRWKLILIPSKFRRDKNHKNIIKLDDNLSMKLKYPSLDQFVENNFEV